jgi:hypothetical protein
MQRQKPRIVEIGRDDDPLLTPRRVEQLDVRGLSQSDLARMSCVMTDGPEVCGSERRHGMSIRDFNRQLDGLVFRQTCGVPQRLVNVGRFEIRIGAKDLLAALATGQQSEQT